MTATTRFSVEVDGQTADSWSMVLAQFDDATFYQSWAYGAVRWGEEHLSHIVLKVDGEIRAAAQLRIARVPGLPIGIAYLRWGPMFRRKGQSSVPETLRAMLDCIREVYVRRRGMTLQVIPNVYADDVQFEALAAAFANAGLRAQANPQPYRTVEVDLVRPPEQIRKELDQKWRNQLNRSEKNGLTLEISDRDEAYGEFLKLYAVMWAKKQFDTSVDVDEFAEIQRALVPTEKFHTFIARKDGEAVGALVCSLCGDTAIYVLGATNDQARELKAAYFLHWQAMLWLKGRGAHTYDLGGIDPIANPGGYHFKSGFGGREATQLPFQSCPGNLPSRLLVAAMTRLRSLRSRKPAVATSS